MNKKTFKEWLELVRTYGIKPGLSRVKVLLERLNNPQNKLQIIHITGTNGKGTTATLLSNILSHAGYKVGQFSSPSILSFNHMFLIDEPIGDEKLFQIAELIKIECDSMVEEGLDHPTEYEIIAAMMYEYFYQEHVDFAVVEVAMGGTNDCTNVMDHSILSVITPISLDHTGFLGATELEIAKEKSGVVKRNSVLVTHPQQSDVQVFLEQDCEEKHSVFITFENQVTCSYKEYMVFKYKHLNVETKLMGEHMAQNIIGVIECVKNLNDRGFTRIEDKILLEAIKATSFEGRFEKINDWIIDGAHNHESLMALKQTLLSLDMNKLTVVFSALKDKAIDDALMALKPLIDRVIIVEANSLRKASLDELESKLKNLAYDDIIRANNVKEAYEIATSFEGQKIGFGSFYMIGDLRKEIKKVH